MLNSSAVDNVSKCLQRGQRFVLTTHVNPDGDGLGCQAALAVYLEQCGKDVYIFNNGPVPRNYDFLDPNGRMHVYNPGLHRETLLTADYIVILDISDWDRLNQVGEDIRNIDIKKVCIDHHPSEAKFGDISLIDTSACSTGEIVFQLLKAMNGKITTQVAEALYTSILTDTGSFKFSNTNQNAFAICAELLAAGVKPQVIYQKIYERQSLGKLRLFGHMLKNIKLEAHGKVAWFAITREILERLGAKLHDTEGFADYPRVLDTVEVTLMFVELEPGRTKVSVRSKGRFVVNTIARKFGGGGHPFAAGILLEGDMNKQIEGLLAEIKDVVRG